MNAVKVWSEPVTFPTYEPAPPDPNPMFLEKRVYQGGSGRLYPIPFTDRIAEKPVQRVWQALHIENKYIYAMILPELGGRIHYARDKANGYNFFYRNDVIKPALVGLAGSWVSGGVEFNWPQHHRPATFMPVDWTIENEEDGSAVIWLGDHDPLCRMKGLLGIRLSPDSVNIEMLVRVHNRTRQTQTFLWWANAAVHVDEYYQSFFPEDVTSVGDHARRATSAFPLCEGHYYGVDYANRARKGVPKSETPPHFVPPRDENGKRLYPPNDLSWYANIPVPTSFMCLGSRQPFFGGYDHGKKAGVLHIANPHISPGKKQWTWGNHPFGYAWDRHLTDANGPYIELMAGVYTDNQPDFTFLHPGESKIWKQVWYPFREIGPACYANEDAALSLSLQDSSVRVGAFATRPMKATLKLFVHDKLVKKIGKTFKPGQAIVETIKVAARTEANDLRLVLEENGVQVAAWQPGVETPGPIPPPATEAPWPNEITSSDELYLTGLHLEQYRHATRCPTLYWREGLRRDPLDARCNNAMGLWHMRRGELEEAEKHFRDAIARLTFRNANPADGEPLYNLGVCLCHRADQSEPAAVSALLEDAYAAFYKATWNMAWQAPSFHALAEIACRRQHWDVAIGHLERSLEMNARNKSARALLAQILLHLGGNADELVSFALEEDPLDYFMRWVALGQAPNDLPTRMDIALDLSRAGFFASAIKLLLEQTGDLARDPRNLGSLPMLHYFLARLYSLTGDKRAARAQLRKAAEADPTYCFPARIEDIAILQEAIRLHPQDARAPYYLGNLFYDRRCHEKAIRLWEKSIRIQPDHSVVWRNLGIGYVNIYKQELKARKAYDRAIRANPSDARLLFERDQLWKRSRVSPTKRLAVLTARLDQVALRDDLSVELCALYNQTGQPQKALNILNTRHFQPWEGGEGMVLAQYVRAHSLLAQAAMAKGNATLAVSHYEQALNTPENLGETRHFLANPAHIHYGLAEAFNALGQARKAQHHWLAAADFRGDFQEMQVRELSEMSLYSALAMMRLGRKSAARKRLNDLIRYARKLARTEARIEYFATSLPTMLLFEDDLQMRQENTALFLEAQARFGQGRMKDARALLATLLDRDPNHADAADLLREIGK